MSAKTKALERKIEKIKQELNQLGVLRIGSLSEQYNVCGTPGCRCKASPPEKHGPYFQLSYTRKGKSTTRHVRRENLAAVKGQLQNYARLQTLMERWIDFSVELSDLQFYEARRSGQKKR